MPYDVLIKTKDGDVWRRAENIVALPDVTSDGEVIQVNFGPDDFPITPEDCNEARQNRVKWREIYKAGGEVYPEDRPPLVSLDAVANSR